MRYILSLLTLHLSRVMNFTRFIYYSLMKAGSVVLLKLIDQQKDLLKWTHRAR